MDIICRYLSKYQWICCKCQSMRFDGLAIGINGWPCAGAGLQGDKS